MDKFLVALIHLPKLTPTRLRRLLVRWSPEALWKISSGEWLEAGVEMDFVQEAISARKNLNPDQIMADLEKMEARLIHENDADFPEQLKNIPGSPAWLFVRGEFKPQEQKFFTVVGPRKISSYGKQVTEEIVRELASNGLTIVSGLAIGVDTEAHRAALAVSGRTVAVLGCGIDQIYPAQNYNLACEILDKNGAIISEYKPGTEPFRQNFPARNRIVSGLAQGVLIAEASEKSGSLITATMAVEQGREVFAVPGSIFSQNSAGTNHLIKSGQAQAVTSAQDILEALEIEDLPLFRETQRIAPTDAKEKIIFELMGKEPKHIDEIIKNSKLSPSEVAVAISLLEMKGMIRDVGSQHYIIK